MIDLTSLPNTAACLPRSFGFFDKTFSPHALTAALGLMLAQQVTAQNFTNLHNFDNFSQSTHDAAFPAGTLVFSGNALYGVAQGALTVTDGDVFRVNTDGSGYTNLHSFTASGDGAIPLGGLVLSGNTLFGTASYGGSGGAGTVFRINTNGSSFTNLHNFSGSDGANPNGDLVLSGNTLYGTAQSGSTGSGTIFKINTDGTGFSNLYSFSATSGTPATNSDGGGPSAVILSGNTLYGATASGGSSGNGTVFAVNTNGTGFTNLHSFSASNTNASGNYTNSDGVSSAGYLALSDNTLYGATFKGGSAGNGTVFKLNSNGTGFSVLHNISPTRTNSSGIDTNSDGSLPQTGLLVLGSTVYGTASGGGNGGNGTMFALNTDGSAFTLLHSFTAGDTNSDGAEPNAGLTVAGNALYGVAYVGGTLGGGTVFSFTLQPQLAIARSGTNVILTWPANFTAFALQGTTSLVSTTVWSNVSPASVVVNGQNTVTNAISSARMFFRLSQ